MKTMNEKTVNDGVVEIKSYVKQHNAIKELDRKNVPIHNVDGKTWLECLDDIIIEFFGVGVNNAGTRKKNKAARRQLRKSSKFKKAKK